MGVAIKNVFTGLTFHLNGKQSQLLPDVGGTLSAQDHIDNLEAARNACKLIHGVTDWMLFKHRIFQRPADGCWFAETSKLVESTIPRP